MTTDDLTPAEPASAADTTPAAQPVPTTAPAPGPAARSGPSVALVIVGVIAIIATAFGAGFLAGRGTAPITAEGSPAPSAAPSGDPSAGPSVAPTPGATSPLADLPREGNRLGLASAPVVVEYWADYQCPFCAQFAQETLPLLADRIAAGSVQVLHRDFAFLGPESYDTAVAVQCAGRQDRYWEMHDAVYAAQDGENQGTFSAELLASLAASVGLDADAFASCVDDRDVLIGVLDETAAGGRAGVTSTPTIDVNGNRFRGVSDPEALLAAVDDAVAGAPASPAPSAQPLPDPWAQVQTDGRTAGAADAPVTVELWVDYQAAGVAALGQQLEPALLPFVNDGSVRLVRRDLALLGVESEAAAATVRCAEDQDASGWFVHDILTTSGAGASGANQGLFVEENLLRFAARVRLDVRAFDVCLRDPAITAAVRAETAEGRAAGLETGPVVIVRSGSGEVERFVGTIDTAAVVAAVEGALGR